MRACRRYETAISPILPEENGKNGKGTQNITKATISRPNTFSASYIFFKTIDSEFFLHCGCTDTEPLTILGKQSKTSRNSSSIANRYDVDKWDGNDHQHELFNRESSMSLDKTAMVQNAAKMAVGCNKITYEHEEDGDMAMLNVRKTDLILKT